MTERAQAVTQLEGVSDEALLAGMGAGHEESGIAFVRRFQGRLFGLALSMVSDRALAEDIAQEALVRAWRHASAYDSRRGTVRAWLQTITRNLAVDTLRMRRAEPVDPEVLMAKGPMSTTQGPEELATLADDSARVRRELIRLPVEQRRALVLAAFFGRTAEEISASESIPLGTAKTRIRAALTKLRAVLIEEPE
jgi:RNA polymerase sigma factor (sigma-70 family)